MHTALQDYLRDDLIDKTYSLLSMTLQISRATQNSQKTDMRTLTTDTQKHG